MSNCKSSASSEAAFNMTCNRNWAPWCVAWYRTWKCKSWEFIGWGFSLIFKTQKLSIVLARKQISTFFFTLFLSFSSYARVFSLSCFFYCFLNDLHVVSVSGDASDNKTSYSCCISIEFLRWCFALSFALRFPITKRAMGFIILMVTDYTQP